MSDKDRIVDLIKETAELRRELARVEEYGDPISIDLTGRALSAVVYALALTWITEAVNQDDASPKLMNMVQEASELILSADVKDRMDEFLNDVLGGDDDLAA